MKSKRLKEKINRIFLLSIGIPLILSIFVQGIYINRLIFRNYTETVSLTLQSMVNHLDSYIESCENFFLQYVFDENLERFYNYVDNHEIVQENTETYYNYFQRASKYRNAIIRYMASNNAYLKQISYVPEKVNQDHIFVMNRAANNVEIRELDGSAYEKLMPRAKALSLNELLITDVVLDVETETFTIIRRINQVERARRQGYLFMEVSKDVFDGLITDLELTERAGIRISYPDGEEAYCSSEAIRGVIFRIDNMDHAREKQRIQVDGRRYCLYSIKSPFGFYIDYLIIESQVTKQAWSIYGIFACIWFCVILAAYILYRRLYRNVNEATAEITGLIENYHLEKTDREAVYQKNSGIEEFDQIGMTLTEMMNRMHQYVREEYILKLHQQAAEYKAMQTEANPHFLNNVLSSFVGLNRMDNRELLEKAILKLAAMFRYTCGHEFDSDVEQECRFIDSYLMLEKLRFEELIEYSIEVEESAGKIKIPRLLLQPIVENAIKHGFDREHKIHIVVSICILKERERSFLKIMVANDGLPIDRDAMRRSTRSDSVGLANVQNRLAAAWPESFFWFSSDSKFVTICNMLILL